MTTGTELIRRTLGNDQEAYALTCPLITKADGKKFGKTESGNIWLDRKRTSPYKFFQFWLNVSDDDAEKYIKIFTSLEKDGMLTYGIPSYKLEKDVIDALIEEHKQDPGRRILQKRLAQEVTVMVHSQEDYDMAVEASSILFGKSTKEGLEKLDEQTFLDVFEGVPTFTIDKDVLGQPIIEVFTTAAAVFPSKAECRKMIQGGGVSLNKEKVSDQNRPVTADDLIDGKYLLAQRGKKNYFLITVK